MAEKKDIFETPRPTAKQAGFDPMKTPFGQKNIVHVAGKVPAVVPINTDLKPVEKDRFKVHIPGKKPVQSEQKQPPVRQMKGPNFSPVNEFLAQRNVPDPYNEIFPPMYLQSDSERKMYIDIQKKFNVFDTVLTNLLLRTSVAEEELRRLKSIVFHMQGKVPVKVKPHLDQSSKKQEESKPKKESSSTDSWDDL